MGNPFLCSWSGGKDSYLACYKAQQAGHQAVVLLNNLNEEGEYSRSHRIPKSILLNQAKCLGLPIHFNVTSWQDYESKFINKLVSLRKEYKVDAAVFGDIDIESHREWEEKVSDAAGLKALLPIWQKDRRALVEEMVEIGMKCLIVSCQSTFAEAILGKTIDQNLLEVFDELNIDACGENGEYHSLVIDGPLHQQVTKFDHGDVLTHNNYSFLDLKD